MIINNVSLFVGCPISYLRISRTTFVRLRLSDFFSRERELSRFVGLFPSLTFFSRKFAHRKPINSDGKMHKSDVRVQVCVHTAAGDRLSD